MNIKLGKNSPRCHTFLMQLWNWDYITREQFDDLLDKGVSVEFKPIIGRRSVDQNARYWSIVGALAQEVGLSKEEMHREVLSEYHGFDLVEFMGSVIKKPKGRSHNLDKQTFNDLMVIAEKWAADMGVNWEAA